jgi:hypothetical protein
VKKPRANWVIATETFRLKLADIHAMLRPRHSSIRVLLSVRTYAHKPKGPRQWPETNPVKHLRQKELEEYSGWKKVLAPSSSDHTRKVRQNIAVQRMKEARHALDPVKLAMDSVIRKLKREHYTYCRGCGVRLQRTDPTKAGYIYVVKDSARERDQKHKDIQKARKDEDVVKVQSILLRVDDATRKKLENTPPEMEDAIAALEKFEKEKKENPEVLFDPELEKGQKQRSICRRCHDLIYHSDPLNHLITKIPAPPNSIDSVMQRIIKDTDDPETGPPLIVHVIDIADFPHSFIPFSVPFPKSKVIFAINRSDLVGERSKSMGHVRGYMQQQLERLVREHKLYIPAYEVVATSGYKKWGSKDLIEAIYNLRSKNSSVYFVGRSLLHVANNRKYKRGKVNLDRKYDRSQRTIHVTEENEHVQTGNANNFRVPAHDARTSRYTNEPLPSEEQLSH